MSGDIETKPSILFWIIAGLFILWGLMGCAIYLMEVMPTDEQYAELFGEELASVRHLVPTWGNGRLRDSCLEWAFSCNPFYLSKANKRSSFYRFIGSGSYWLHTELHYIRHKRCRWVVLLVDAAYCR